MWRTTTVPWNPLELQLEVWRKRGSARRRRRLRMCRTSICSLWTRRCCWSWQRCNSGGSLTIISLQRSMQLRRTMALQVDLESFLFWRAPKYAIAHRLCLQSPSKSVECCLCLKRGGAFNHRQLSVLCPSHLLLMHGQWGGQQNCDLVLRPVQPGNFSFVYYQCLRKHLTMLK